MFWQDVRYGFRKLRRSPGSSFVVILILALGIGANTAIYSFVDGVLFTPLPYPDAGRLITVWDHDRRNEVEQNSVSPADYADWRNDNRVFDKLAAIDRTGFTLTGLGEPERASGAYVVPEFFAVVGVPPLLGRGFLPEEAADGRDRVVVLSHPLWQQRYGGDRQIVGKTVAVEGEGHTVVGVMPSGFQYPGESRMWKPLVLGEDLARNRRFLEVLGRLAPGVTLAQARSGMDVIAARLAREYPASNAEHGIHLLPLSEQLVGDVRPALIILWAAVGLVLLITCANVANLLLARALARQSEIGIRTALGAAGGRLARQLLTESLILGLLGGLAGIGVAAFLLRALLRLVGDEFPRLEEVGLHPGVLAFTLGLALFTGLLFGLAPALASRRTDLTTVLKDGAKASAGRSRHRLRGALVVAEVALTLVLLVGAGLLSKSFFELTRITPGFERDNVLTTVLVLPEKYEEPHQQLAFYDQVLAGVRALPEVKRAAFITPLPMSGGSERTGFRAESQPEPEPGKAPRANYRVVSEDYFATLGVDVVEGRSFLPSDTAGAAKVVIVNQKMAGGLWPGQNALGQRISFGRTAEGERIWWTVVGVVEDVKHQSLTEESGLEVYASFRQDTWSFLYLVVQTRADPYAALPGIRRVVFGLDQELPLIETQTMEEVYAKTIARPLFNTTLVLAFAVLSLILAVVGIYGVISHSVRERRGELGVRLALGASNGQIVGMVLRQGLLLALAGIVLGLLGAFLSTRLLASLLFGIGTTDPSVFGGVILVMVAVAALACLVPAIRATRIDPVAVLR